MSGINEQIKNAKLEVVNTSLNIIDIDLIALQNKKAKRFNISVLEEIRNKINIGRLLIEEGR